MSTLATSTRATSRSARLASITLASTVTSQSSTSLLRHHSPRSPHLPRLLPLLSLLLLLPLLPRSPPLLLAMAKTVVPLLQLPASPARVRPASLLSLPLPLPRALLLPHHVFQDHMAQDALLQQSQPQLLPHPHPRLSLLLRRMATARFPRRRRHLLTRLPSCHPRLTRVALPLLRARLLPLRLLLPHLRRALALLAVRDMEHLVGLRRLYHLPRLPALVSPHPSCLLPLLPALVFLQLHQLDTAPVLPLQVPQAPLASQALLPRSLRTQSILLRPTLPRKSVTSSLTA